MRAEADLILSIKSWLGIAPPPAYLAEPFGLDVSAHQGVINWPAMPDHVRFVGIRAGYGLIPDKLFYANRDGAISKGIKWLAYWALYPNTDYKAQLRLLMYALNSNKGDWPPAWDVEVRAKMPNSRIVEATQYAMAATSMFYGEPCVLYSSENYLKDLLTLNNKPPTWINQYPLWIARYLFANPATGYANEHPGPLRLPWWIQREQVKIHQTAGKGRGKPLYPVQSWNLDYNRLVGRFA